MQWEVNNLNKGKLGVVYGIVIILLVGLSLTFVLSAPTSSGGGLIDPAGLKVKGTIDQTVYADASGWNYSHGPINPTLYFPLDYKICFTVIEDSVAEQVEGKNTILWMFLIKV